MSIRRVPHRTHRILLVALLAIASSRGRADQIELRAKLAPLLAAAASPSYDDRVAAHESLAKLAEDPSAATETLAAALDALGTCRDDDWWTYDKVWHAVWSRWLETAPPDAVFDPAPSDAELDAELAVLLASSSSGAEPEPRRAALADRRFRSWIVQSSLHERLVRRLEQIAASDVDARRAQAAEQLAQEMAPALCAEIWHSDVAGPRLRHFTAQFLTIGVPQYPEKAAKATYFVEANESIAKLEEGNSLEQGEYPVGVAFAYLPAPISPVPWAYHLVYLPTPRERYRFEFELEQVAESERWRRIGEKTIAHLAAKPNDLTPLDLWLIAHFSSSQIARLAAPVLAHSEDRLLPGVREGRQISRHAALCELVRDRCEPDAAEMLLDGLASGDLEGVAERHGGLLWQAITLSAARGAAPDDDAVLVRIVRDFGDHADTPADDDMEPTASPIASAAVMLLERHGASPGAFGVEVLGRLRFDDANAVGDATSIGSYPVARFLEPDARERVLAWRERLSAESNAAGEAATTPEVN